MVITIKSRACLGATDRWPAPHDTAVNKSTVELHRQQIPEKTLFPISEQCSQKCILPRGG
jgi:hypothetical protein